MITKKLAILVLNEALSTGADYAEIFYEDSHSNVISVENGKVDSTNSSSLCGVGLRLLLKNQSVYGYTNDLTKKGLLELASSLSKSFNGQRLIEVRELNMIRVKNRNPVGRSYDDVPKEETIALIKKGTDVIKDMNDPRIVRYTGSFVSQVKFIAVFNSKGKWFKRNT
jgi:TldD protein